jgi:hypothetical protein
MSRLREATRGLGLTDFSFEVLAGRRLAKVLFALAWLGLLAVALGLVIFGLYLMLVVGGVWFLAGVALIFIVAPIVLFVGVMIVRVLLELVVVLIQIEANTRPPQADTQD